ncbi:VOC family protein [Rhodococcus jostii]|uniref:3,4-dihydroxy-9,10-secoandrosta-1,3,5(10)-triene-9,17-dione 4,5-dioxygenase n=1 Tax=Rhodococcus jostii TaxID=132919 RepID=A0A1H4ISM1_RHOJO|nr:VOC family protein [Rhodococcus jostii]SEB37121.1 3,4-dihydroxy-9,10-secoandrosta-1,3,5(10)-triene-9,17-dione 4,5-dioxygenase [Rhodococcus jostii]
MLIQRLGYAGLLSSDAEGWRTFGPDVLGMPLGEDSAAGAVRLRLGSRPFSLSVLQSDTDGLDYLGWEATDRRALIDVADRLKGMGVDIEELSAAECADRRVDEAIRFTDPNEYVHEVYAGSHAITRPVVPVGHCSGFVGMGHAFLLVPDAPSTEGFFRDAFDLSVSDRLDFGMGESPFEPGPARVTVSFVTSGPHHHLLALAQGPADTDNHGLAHIMIEVRELDDLGFAYDRATERNCVVTTMGRHVNDQMVSFYAAGPGGTPIEYSWGGRPGPSEQESIPRYDKSSIWGHRPIKESVTK